MFSLELKRAGKDPLVGTTVSDQFVLTERLGSGSLSIVYKAKNKANGRFYAIKYLKQDTGDEELARVLFEREMEMTKNLVHPNVASVIDAGITNDGTPFLILDFIDGPSLAQMMEKTGPISPYAAVKIIAEICQGMSYAHSKGVLHCDLKPSNVMIHCENGSSQVVKIIDFGIGKLLGKSDSLSLGDNGVLGSLCYMSPEVLQQKAVDERADIYSLGCLIHDILSGQPPFIADEPRRIVQAHLSAEPRPLLDRLVDGGPGVVRDATWHNLRTIVSRYDAIIAKCLRKDPSQRYQTMAELKADVERAVDRQQLTTGRLKSTVTRTAVQWEKTRAKKAFQRHVLFYAVFGLAVLLVLVLAFCLKSGINPLN